MAAPISAADLGIDFSAGRETALFKWLLASWLMGKRIQAPIAAQAYRVLVDDHGLDSPAKLAKRSHRDLVKLLGEGHYRRYDESSAERLLALAHTLNDHYDGKVGQVHAASEHRAAFEKRLLTFAGIGPKTVEIFMRDAAPVLY